MRMHVTAIMVVAALGLAVAATVSPNATIMANEASTEIHGLDILGLTRDASPMPTEQYTAI